MKIFKGENLRAMKMKNCTIEDNKDRYMHDRTKHVDVKINDRVIT